MMEGACGGNRRPLLYFPQPGAEGCWRRWLRLMIRCRIGVGGLLPPDMQNDGEGGREDRRASRGGDRREDARSCGPKVFRVLGHHMNVVRDGVRVGLLPAAGDMDFTSGVRLIVRTGRIRGVNV